MASNSTSYISGLVHPASWIHDNDQIILLVGTVWWFATALVFLVFFVCGFSHIRKYPMSVTAYARIIVLAAMLGVAYMYTSARELLFEREDGVLVRTPLVLMNAAINVLLVYVGSVHCVLSPEYDQTVLWLGALATGQTTLASFVPASQQWAGWVVGALFYVPLPFIWVLNHRRATPNHKINMNVAGWVMMWLFFRTLYAMLQLSGHTFAAENGLDTTVELALMLALHTATLVPLFYAAKTAQAPPRPPGKYKRALSTGDSAVIAVSSNGAHAVTTRPAEDGDL